MELLEMRYLLRMLSSVRRTQEKYHPKQLNVVLHDSRGNSLMLTSLSRQEARLLISWWGEEVLIASEVIGYNVLDVHLWLQTTRPSYSETIQPSPTSEKTSGVHSIQ